MIRVEDVYRDDARRVWYVGPFMPHAGSATTNAEYELGREENIPDAVQVRHLSIETLFLAPGESDLALEPR